ncbi:ATP-dependent Clp protease ATP-binding subunit ClpA [Pedobacter psychrotolerans]|uniref:ATP-dependent Clp protease ATP-binding subunit ClpA n=1 Tax=Pedobacter psychrotolerans TaxID=1843235 RepID=A0A4R2HET4_9SPHI|nr:ATP-dependent Clp protease ATP-binding subunit [Pedobacter psychrotolerans]TCO26810.1 ATP-dependent Clp protease ATP-binding subunit ClpA [Pedobacter psychrotolerans]GGE56681.1 ATPase AAA [Pedobacter psychrotolerans]
MAITNLSESVKTALHIAQSLAKEYRNEVFTAAHLLKGLMHKDVGLRSFITSIGKDEEYISEWAEVRIEELAKSAGLSDTVSGAPEIAVIFEEADNVRIKLGLDLITPVCVLTALAKPGIGFQPDQLKSFPIKEREILDLYVKDEEISRVVSPDKTAAGAENKSTGNALYKYCIDRLQMVRDAKTDPIIGRDKETRMMMEILCRRTKPNVILTGDAGVGKTALVDGFAIDIVNQNVPDSLKPVQLFELDLGSLIAGASYKGEIEDRLKNIIKEVKQFEKAVLFIDEIHTLLDSKGPLGAGIGNLLKPELARGEITVIGATTIDEYRKIIEPEQAFSRRFEVLQVNEPNEESTIKMLQKLAVKYEEHHNLSIEPDALGECVRLAKRYMKDRRLPDSAFDLLDRTMAAMKMMNDTSDQVITSLEADLEALNADEEKSEADQFADYKWLFSLLQNKLSPVLLGRLTDETQTDAFETAEEYQGYINSSLQELKKYAAEKSDRITKQDIASIVAYKTGIPMGKLQAGEKEKLLNMEQYLKKRVVGQDQALKAVSNAILESRSGLNKKGQPIGSFFLLGPTGTGKTELAKSIAEFLFNDEKAMIRFDMSEFKEEHSAALLYGAPPGYVGYEEGGLLVNKIRQQPYSVLLFDEIEKAHPSVFDTFLQILDEGHMHDRLGKEGDFSNSLILFTSNIGSEWIAEQIGKGVIPASNQLMEVMAGHFRPEFLARISEIVPFAPINESNVVRIFEIQLNSLIQSLNKMGIEFEIAEDAKKMIALDGFTPKYGARQLSAVIRNLLRRPISKYIISGELKKGSKIVVSKHPEEDQLEWNIIQPEASILEQKLS